MKSHYKIFALAGCGLALSACQTTTSTSVATTQNPSNADQSVVAYFSSMETGGVLLTNARNADVYRVLIKHDQRGYLVQDFFQASKKPQSSPVLLTNPADLNRVAPTSMVGDLTLYYPNGHVYQRATYSAKHQPIGPASTYNPQGKLVVQEENRADGSYSGRFWYPANLHLALTFEMNANNQVTSAKGWDEQQHAIPSSQCFAENTLNPKNTNDQCYQLLMQLYQASSTMAD
ncbi:hypothetical protein [Acinetobacter sp. MB5]|uniref:hypothetical protein n=1 Tax=Acinetobacter sp. MB5 TaxID=2069438 RepID=UPI000DD0E894|nr:hypothetical protein [Acinetobacter sp. MB5]